MPSFPSPRSLVSSRAPNPPEKRKCCCSKIVLAIFVAIFCALTIVLCGSVIYLKLEVDALKKVAKKAEHLIDANSVSKHLRLHQNQTFQNETSDDVQPSPVDQQDPDDDLDDDLDDDQADDEAVLINDFEIEDPNEIDNDDDEDGDFDITTLLPTQDKNEEDGYEGPTRNPEKSTVHSTKSTTMAFERPSETTTSAERSPTELPSLERPPTTASTERPSSTTTSSEKSSPTTRNKQDLPSSPTPPSEKGEVSSQKTTAKPKTATTESTTRTTQQTSNTLRAPETGTTESTSKITTMRTEASIKTTTPSPTSESSSEVPKGTVQETTNHSAEEDLENPCTEQEFLCQSGKCINASLACDGHVDCGPLHPTDEADCPCLERLPAQRICDGVYDCHDGSDEFSCPFCKDSNKCSDGRCVPDDRICDGRFDCLDGNDERSCTKLSETFNQDHIFVPNQRGYLMQRVFDEWLPICYHGRFLDRNSGLRKEELALAVLCSDYHGFIVPRVPFDRVPVANLNTTFNGFLEYERSSAKVLPTCASGILVYAECPKRTCPTEVAVPIEEPPISFIRLSTPLDWPWNAIVFRDGSPECSATMISSKLFVTAASCISNPGYFEIKIGSVSQIFQTPYQSIHPVAATQIHKDYNPQTLANDIALLEIDSELIQSAAIQDICLTPNNITYSGKLCQIVGYGGSDLDADIQWDTVIKINNTCDGDKQLCGQLLDEGCEEHVGAGVYCQISQDGIFSWTLAGMTIQSSNCSIPGSGKYLDISKYIEWIDDTTKLVKSGDVSIVSETCSGIICDTFFGSRCVSSEETCDKTADCVDASDEENCL